MYDTILLFDEIPKTRGLQVIRVRAQAITSCQPTAYPMDMLKEDYNAEFVDQGLDVYVTECKQIRGAFSNSLAVDMSVGTVTGGLIDPVTIALIFLIIRLIAYTVAAVVILSKLSGLAEIVYGKPPKFYASDGKEFDSLAAYITYQQSINPTGYVCHYCGQIFDTAVVRDAHEEECPWKGGVPGPKGPFDWLPWAMIGLGALIVLPRVLPSKKG